MSRNGIIWFRNDLRLHDNAPLLAASKNTQLIPVYCFDPRHFETTHYGFPKTGPYRTTFLLESVSALRDQLRSLGSDLIIRYGKPEIEIPEIARANNSSALYFHKEFASEEIAVEKALVAALAKDSFQVYPTYGNFLYHPDDLPFPVNETPNVFTQFRKTLEKRSHVQSPLPVPDKLPPLPENISPGELPDGKKLGIALKEPDRRRVLNFTGGELNALKRVQHYLWDSRALSSYKLTRNGLLGEDYSSKFSPWLANGCLSPRQIHQAARRYEQEVEKNQSTYWLIFELVWRDFFRYVAWKYGRRIFFPGGIRDARPNWQDNEIFMQAWQDGKTGIPFIDANMRELNESGFMSNRGRQNVASFLVKDLRQDWRFGAAYFESMLIDYDVYSNWGNWNYVAGIGNDPREDRYFNVISQAKRYDPKGDYVRHWLPELQTLPVKKIHIVFQLDNQTLQKYKIRPGKDYPQAIYTAKAWRKHLSSKY